jgi:hypothetical protein
MRADGGGVKRVTDDGFTVIDQDPVWSPDSRRIGFARNNEIYVMNADGSGKRNLTANPATDGEPCWSPDGRRIGFASDRGGSTDVYTMRAADGRDLKRLTSEPATDTHCEWQPLALPATRRTLRLSVRPRRVTAGERNTFRFQVLDGAGGTPVEGATVDFAGRRSRTGGRGRASTTTVLKGPRTYVARATKPGYAAATTSVVVTRPRSGGGDDDD